MALLYNPLDGSELDEPVQPYPRSAFLMIHDNDRVAAVEARMQLIAREELANAGFEARAASGLRRSGDYLSKIIRMIRGCGFGVAIFSDATPPRTIANIFFEVGYCLALGKPTFLLLAGPGAAPSDFVRSEWIEYKHGEEGRFRQAVREACSGIDEYNDYLLGLALSAEDAEEMNPEVTFEWFKRSYLLSGGDAARDGIGRLKTKVRAARSDEEVGILMKSSRRKLSDEIAHFERLCR